MNNNIFNIDLTRTLPPVLKNDSRMQALSRVVADELQENARLIKNNIIYARIDELPEKILDVLAYDLHIDWYNYDYPVQIKRDLIKTSVKVHKKLGTVYAVETALRTLYPNAEIKEWFEYGGESFLFRIIIDISLSRITPEVREILRVINTYKRLTAHLEKIIYTYKAETEIKSVAVGGLGNIIKVKVKVVERAVITTEDKAVSVIFVNQNILVKTENEVKRGDAYMLSNQGKKIRVLTSAGEIIKIKGKESLNG